MRVISGEYRSRQIKTLEGPETRPTLDKIKGAVFNHLGKLEGKTFLDLFCGCGNIGIEALSRGAKQVTFNDNNPQAIKILKDNLNSLKVIDDRYQVVNLSYRELLTSINEQFDIIYLDPPFASDFFLSVLELIKEYGILKKRGEIVVESEIDEELGNAWFDSDKTVFYGRIKISYLRNIQ